MLLRDLGCGLVGLKACGRVPCPLAQSEYISRISVDGVVARASRPAAADDYLTHIPKGGSFTPIGQLAGS
jgi:hypothetical protein